MPSTRLEKGREKSPGCKSEKMGITRRVDGGRREVGIKRIREREKTGWPAAERGGKKRKLPIKKFFGSCENQGGQRGKIVGRPSIPALPPRRAEQGVRRLPETKRLLLPEKANYWGTWGF